MVIRTSTEREVEKLRVVTGLKGLGQARPTSRPGVMSGIAIVELAISAHGSSPSRVASV
jgi:hypothetical protein